MESQKHGPVPAVRITLAGPGEREQIYSARHRVYALELGQHHTNPQRRLRDPLDDFNCYIVARQGTELLGFVSVTTPGRDYSIDKYFQRANLPFRVDDKLYEVRLLTVPSSHRGRFVAPLLMYAAFRLIESQKGTQLVVIGRREVLDLYLRFGFERCGMETKAGAVTYDLLTASSDTIRRILASYEPHLHRIERQIAWELPFSFRRAIDCEHGGSFWSAVGDDFASLEKAHEIISADVLDAWFPPAPQVIAALERHLPVLVRTSPPTRCEGMVRAIASARGLNAECILPAAGSSALIFLAFRRWLTSQSRALVIDPGYGEYAHVLANVIGCQVDSLPLCRANQYRIDAAKLAQRLSAGYDIVVLVNPNSPTGVLLARSELEPVLAEASANTRVWIDETYIEYAGLQHSVEHFAARSAGVFVCKSMSKAYALSGLRAAYLAGPAVDIQDLRQFVPPWSVSLPAQVAVVHALAASDYYSERYCETRVLRQQFAAELRGQFGFEVVPSDTNFLLCHVPASCPPAAEICQRTQQRGVFLRDAGHISSRLGERCIRIAVKDAIGNRRVLEVLGSILPMAESALA